MPRATQEQRPSYTQGILRREEPAQECALKWHRRLGWATRGAIDKNFRLKARRVTPTFGRTPKAVSVQLSEL